jgi:SAM-dependent methyltransferase
VNDLGECTLTTAIRGLPEYERDLITASGAGRLYQCRDCRLGFRYPQVDDAALQMLYSRMPTRRWKYQSQVNTAWDLGRKFLDRIQDLGTGPRRILDIGAFDGIFLKSLSAKWDRYAIEPSADAQTALQQEGITVVGDFVAPPPPALAGTFDVVTLFDVFEHLRQPGVSLGQAAQFLRPGGHLLLSTGNMQHWSWNWVRGDHWYCHPLQHLTFGSPEFFRKWALRHGCRYLEATLHPHHPAPWATVCSQTLETVLWGLRQSNRWQWLAKLMLRLPGFGTLRHRQAAPYAPALADHLFVVLQKQ